MTAEILITKIKEIKNIMELLVFIFVTYFIVTIFTKKPNKNYYSSSNPKQTSSNYTTPDELEITKKGKIQRKKISY